MARIVRWRDTGVIGAEIQYQIESCKTLESHESLNIVERGCYG